MTTQRDKIPFDVLFVGGGPANLAGAIHLMTLAAQKNIEIEVALIDKGQQIGSHALSGAVINPGALAELLPDYLEKGFPLEKKVNRDRLFFLTENGYHRIPWTPGAMRNEGFYTVSLSRMTRWLADIAESLGVAIFPGFAGKEVLFKSNNRTIAGVRTGDKGLDRSGTPKKNFEQGIDLLADITIFGEGPKGSLTREIDTTLGLFPAKAPQVFETGIKEVIKLPEDDPFFSTVCYNDIHTLGYPLDLNTAGGGFVYEMDDARIALGFVTGLGYSDPAYDISDALIRFKQHPFISRIIKNGKVVEQGARTITGSGYYGLPRLAVNGAMFVGGCAGIQNLPALKGIHLSMKSGMLAAEAAVQALEKKDFSGDILSCYPQSFYNSWAGKEMWEGRNFSRTLAGKGAKKFFNLGAQFLTRGRGIVDPMPCQTADHLATHRCRPDGEDHQGFPEIEYDNELLVDKMTGVYLSKTMHREDQPCHLHILDPSICTGRCYEAYRNPCLRFCPGNVYEIAVDDATGRREMKLNPSNCLHCKTCEIKDPFQNVVWTCPEGGDGPNYTVV